MARRGGGGRLPRRRGRSNGRLHPFLDRRPGARDGGEMVRRPRRPHARRGRGRSVGAGFALGAVARRRALSPSLWRAAARRGRLGAAAAARRPTAATTSESSRADEGDGRADDAAAAQPAARDRASRDDRGAEIRAVAAEDRFAAGARRQRLRPRLPQSDRHGGGLRQERRSRRRAARARLRLRRGRHADAAAAKRQSAAAAVSAGRRRRADQSHGLQQRRLRRGARAAGGAAGRAESSASTSAPTATPSTASPTSRSG